MIKVRIFFKNMYIDDEINEFLENNNVEYVDMEYIGERAVLLVYREKENMPERKPYEKYPEKRDDSDD